jgi:peptidoglycan/LPS O-acetylase OafA/YrhL
MVRVTSSSFTLREDQPAHPRPGGRFLELDGLRGVAAMMVLLQHLAIRFCNGFEVGTVAVRVFFVLSGFLITGILLDSRRKIEIGRQSLGRGVGRFYFRRFLRLIPVLYLAVIVSALLNLGQARHSWPWDLTYLSNFYAVREHTLGLGTGHFWTLAIEEQFYLFWPWIILFIPRRHMMGFLLAVILSAPLFRIAMMLTHRGPMWYLCLPPGSLDALGLGALLACARLDGARKEPMIRRLEKIGWIVGLPLTVFGLWALRGEISLVAIRHSRYWFWAVRPMQFDQLILTESAYALLGFAAVASLVNRPHSIGAAIMRWPPLVYLGTISYGLYVYHIPIACFYMQYLRPHFARLPADNIYYFFTLTLMSIALASLSWFLMEKPITRWKHRRDASTLEPGIKAVIPEEDN